MDDWKEKVFVAKNLDGGVSVIYPSPNYRGTRDDFFRRHDLDIADELAELYPIQLPAERSFRNSWVLEGGKVIIKSDDDSKVKDIDDTGEDQCQTA